MTCLADHNMKSVTVERWELAQHEPQEDNPIIERIVPGTVQRSQNAVDNAVTTIDKSERRTSVNERNTMQVPLRLLKI